jgi:hypothetical protein
MTTSLIKAFLATAALAGAAWAYSNSVSEESNYAEWGPYPPVAPFSNHALPHTWSLVDMYFPLVGDCHFHNDYDSSRGSYRHTGIDIGAGPMTPIVAPFSGTIGFKRETFWIYGDNGWAALGTHLNDNNYGKHDHRGDRDVMFAPYLVPGQHITGGEFIGYVGDSGNATGPHLHFELFAPGSAPIAKRIRNPWPSLMRSQRLHTARISIPNPDQKPDPHELRLQACVRTTMPEHHKAIFILVAKETPKGKVIAVSHMRYIRLYLSEQAVQEAGGWEALSRIPEHRTLSLYVPDRTDIEGATIQRLVID